MKSEHEIRPASTLKNTVRPAGFSLDRPTYPEERRE
jgi:hypothetical protein